jgi:hypothetical protein
MAHLFIIRRGTDHTERRAELLELAHAPCILASHAAPDAGTVRIVPFDSPPRFAVVAPDCARVRVNGEPLRAGIRVLQDRDEVRSEDLLAYFAAHSPPRLEEFSEALHGRLHCPVCTRPLAGPAVRCPRCARFYCETEDFPCWSSGPTCPSGDGQPTALDAEPDWIPEILQEASA